MPVTVKMKAEGSVLSFPKGDDVETNSNGALKVYQRGENPMGTYLGGVAADQWSSYEIEPNAE